MAITALWWIYRNPGSVVSKSMEQELEESVCKMEVVISSSVRMGGKRTKWVDSGLVSWPKVWLFLVSCFWTYLPTPVGKDLLGVGWPRS